MYFSNLRRGHIDGKATAYLVEFIKSDKKTLNCAIYDLKDPGQCSQSVADKVTLRIAYDGGKQKEVKGRPSLDPKLKAS